jgi:hypothetical protein
MARNMKPHEIEQILEIPIDSDEEFTDLSDDEAFILPVSYYLVV